MTALLVRLWRLLRLCISGPGGRLGLLYFFAVFGLSLVGIQITVWMIAWSADFYNALQKLDAAAAIRQIGIFVILVSASSAQFLIASYIKKLLQIRWRAALTSAVLDRWLHGKAFWHLQQEQVEAIDNPDQRIAEDCRLFVKLLTDEALDLITTSIGLVTYVALLWKLSTFPLAFSLFGFDIEIPHYMVWAAPIYVAISSGVTHLLGGKLMRLTVEQQKREADYRFALARLRESSEAVGMAGGEAAERRILDGRFGGIVANWHQLIRREFILGMFTRPYMMTVLRVPIFLALPAFLAGKVTLGGLMQLGQAFQSVVTSLSWFIFSYRDLAELVASSRRLNNFLDRIDTIHAHTPTVLHAPSDDGVLRVSELALRDPNGQPIAAIDDLVIGRGEAVWLRGPSGIGKSTSLKAFAGLWRHGDGVIQTPAGRSLFLSQQAYLPLSGLRAAAVYPAPDDERALARADVLLDQVGLGARLEQSQAGPRTGCPASSHVPGAERDAHDVRGLSGGQQQRLVLARVLAARPDWVFMDEATSALDQEAEEELLTLLRRSLPDTSFIVIAHRMPRGLGPLRIIDFPGAPAATPSRPEPRLSGSPVLAT